MSPIELNIRIPFNGDTALGPGKVDLLEAIVATGSISAAAKSMHMSYKRAWDLVNMMNNSFNHPLVITATGGKHGGGAEVSDFGLSVIQIYRQMEQQALVAIDTTSSTLMSELKQE
jgi:molybdate transport system regulatory protein